LFLDFVSSLYTKFYSYQNDKHLLLSLTPFFDKQLLDQFVNNQETFKISEIVIGGLYIEKIVLGEKTSIYVRIKSNMTIEAQGKTARYKINERWLFMREKGVLSPEPEKMHVVSCPYCGAPADFNDIGYCKHCGNLVVPGKMQWYVIDRTVFNFTVYPTQSLLTYAPEKGTQLPTIFDPYLAQKAKVFEQANNVIWSEYQEKFKNKIVRPYFDAIYDAWSNLKWEKVRHLLSDRLWESYNFWIKAYKEHRWRNIADVKIENIEIVKLEIDRFYEAITVRIFADGYDYVINERGKVLAGSRRVQRRFSEYWTFIRRSGVEKDEYDLNTCPACGAPAENIGQSGICEYCGNKITWGDFSWILAIITQDEEYKG
jgi:ribosomal protein L37AE/L43A